MTVNVGAKFTVRYDALELTLAPVLSVTWMRKAHVPVVVEPGKV